MQYEGLGLHGFLMYFCNCKNLTEKELEPHGRTGVKVH